MSPFQGFPARSELTPLPNIFFSQLLPQIDDLAELKTTLHIFWLIHQKKGYLRFVSLGELLGDQTLMEGLEGNSPAESLRAALVKAEKRGTLLHLGLEKEGKKFNLYFLNSPSTREAMSKIAQGEVALGEIASEEPEEMPVSAREEKPNIFALYEQNIGLLTPMLAEELKEAERLYPPSWVEDAFKEAVRANKRNWRYIAAILEHWLREGRESGKPERPVKRESAPDKYFRGRYGHLVRR